MLAAERLETFAIEGGKGRHPVRIKKGWGELPKRVF